MSFFQFITNEQSWVDFLEIEEQKEFKDLKVIRQVQRVIDKQTYNKLDKDFFNNFKLPKLVKISQYNTSKKRIVYVYPGIYRLVLKLMAHYILMNYNETFAKNSLAYTKGKSVKTAFKLLKSYNLTEHDTIYKNDFSDYFNSIDIGLLDNKLKNFLTKDIDLYEMIMKLLREDQVIVNNKIQIDNNKGVMAGSPIAGILANVFVDNIDKLMLEKKYKYIRYADDTLIIGKEALDFFILEIEKLGINFNPKKMQVFNITTGLTFLGFKHINNTIDISDEARAKMKSRLKRRAKWYRQWMLRKNVKKEVAIKDYIKKLNFKIFTDQDDSINWSRWYFPNINTIKTIKYLEDYFINCIRYLDSGTWKEGKKYYRLSYEDIKNFGYRSLINEYYRIIKKNSKKY
jgi:hypothetical protein